MKLVAVAIAAAMTSGMALADGLYDKIPAWTIGDKAPSIDIEHWVKGEEVREFEPGKIYVVEFWATWCGPCRAIMPQISDMQEKYRNDGVTFIGVSDEKLDVVDKFVNSDEWKDKLRYRITTDPDLSTHRWYMEATAQGFIPTAFIVGKDSRVQWIGSPFDLHKEGEETPLDKVIRDSWDASAFRSEWEKKMAPEFEKARKMLPFRKARAEKDWPTLLSIYDQRIAEEPKNFNLKSQKFKLLVGQINDPLTGYAWGRELIAADTITPGQLNDLAWHVLDHADVGTRDFDFALHAALKANALSQGKDGAILDTLARAYWESGDKDKAIQTQRDALQVAPEQLKQELTQTLRKYEGR